MTVTQEHCGDTCGLIDFTMAVAGDRLLPEERMKLAVEAVTTEKMSQRGAAKKYGVSETTLRRQVRQMAHPAKTQSQPKVSKGQPKAKRGQTLTKEVVRSALRKLCKEQGGAPKGFSQSLPLMRGWLKWAGIAIPPELDGKTEPFNPSSTPSSLTPAQTHDTDQQGFPANDPLPVVSDGSEETDPEDDDAIFDERIDLKRMSKQVNEEVQRSNRAESFKRAIQLTTELEELVTRAFYGQGDWHWQDWVHLNGQLKTCQSLTGQRSEEACSEVLDKRALQDGAITV